MSGRVSRFRRRPACDGGLRAGAKPVCGDVAWGGRWPHVPVVRPDCRPVLSRRSSVAAVFPAGMPVSRRNGSSDAGDAEGRLPHGYLRMMRQAGGGQDCCKGHEGHCSAGSFSGCGIRLPSVQCMMPVRGGGRADVGVRPVRYVRAAGRRGGSDTGICSAGADGVFLCRPQRAGTKTRSRAAAWRRKKRLRI